MNDRGEIQHGTVGWDGEDSVENQGDGVGDYTFVRVTLFAGRDRSEPDPTPDVAKGERVVAMLPGQQVPKKGSLVVCLRPAETANWFIAANPVRNTTDQFKGASQTLLDYGDDTDVVIRGRNVTLQSADGYFIAVGSKTGAQLQTPDGSGLQIKTGGRFITWVSADGDARSVFEMTADKISVKQKNSGGKTTATEWGNAGMKSFGSGFFTARFSKVFLGQQPTLLTPMAMVPPLPALPTPVASFTCYVSP